MAEYKFNDIQHVKSGDEIIFGKEQKMSTLKPCPYRVHGERTASLMVSGEFYYNECFMPCMRQECACFHIDCGDAYCDRNGTYMKLGNLKGADDE